MRIFVTGASGFIGRALMKELLDHSHTVLALARSDVSAETVVKLGATPYRGDLNNLQSLKAGAQQCDAVIHLAFIHDFNNLGSSIDADQAAITALSDGLEGSGKPLVIASGTLLTAKGGVATEDTGTVQDGSIISQRAKSADLVYELTKTKHIRGVVVRVPPTVHGEEDQGLVPTLVAMAKKNGRAIYIGDGSARWPTVNVQDCAALFRLAAEKGAAGATYHAVGDEGITQKAINELIGSRLGVPVESKDIEEAAQFLGFMAHMIAADSPCSSVKTRKELGWVPSGPGLLDDMSEYYFTASAKSQYA